MLLEEAYDHCEKVIAKHSKTFYKAFGTLRYKDRRAVWAVYAFCRLVDDIVDEGEEPVTGLRNFTREFEDFLNGLYNDQDPMWVALQDVFTQYDIDVQAFHDMIKGQKMDLERNRYRTMEELLHYCYHVASTVGLMLLPILAPGKSEELRPSAVSLGLAMQLTNILRDVGEDLARNRIYLPMEVMERYHLTEEMILTQKITLEFIDTWESMAAHAELLYNESFKMMNQYPLYSRTAVKGAAILYRQNLKMVRKKCYQVYEEIQNVDEAGGTQSLMTGCN